MSEGTLLFEKGVEPAVAAATSPSTFSSPPGFAEFVTTGGRWTDAGNSSGGFTTALGGSGGVVAWSLTGAGLTDQTGSNSYSGLSVALGSFLGFDFVATLRAAFDAWSAAANIEFIQVQDGGSNWGAGSFPTIRIAGGFTDGAGGNLAWGFFPSSFNSGGDIVFDSGQPGWTAANFFHVALHEIGHALGLDHQSNPPLAIMNPTVNMGSPLSGLQADDIAGIRAVYGVQDFGASSYYMPAGQLNLDLIYSSQSISVHGNAFGNVIHGAIGGEQLYGHDRNDFLYGGGGADILSGDAGSDILGGGPGNDLLDGGVGDDIADFSDALGAINFNLSAATIALPGLGTDTLISIEGVIGSAFADIVVGTNAANSFSGGAGNDYFYARDGSDGAVGGSGVDVLIGEGGDDALYGGADFDYLFGGAGNDFLYGDDFVDVLYGGAGADTLYGGANTDHLFGEGGIDTLYGGAGNDVFYGSGGPDVMYGADGQDYFYASLGTDAALMYGGAGVDVLLGSGGNDTFYGGADVDYFFGGGGADSFVIQTGGLAEVLSDFAPGLDTVTFQDTGFSSFAQVRASMAYYAGINTTIVTTPDGSTAVWLIGHNPSDFTAADFLFG